MIDKSKEQMLKASFYQGSAFSDVEKYTGVKMA